MTTTTPTTDTNPDAMWTARDAYDLTIYERSADGRRTLVGDGQERFWVDSPALDEDVPAPSGSADFDADAYAKWCVGGHASEEK